MQRALELGQCLYILIGACVVAWGIWRAQVRRRQSPSATAQTIERPAGGGFSIRGELARLFLAYGDGEIMSHDENGGARIADTEAVHVPVPSTDTDASTSAPALDINDADDWEMPRIGRRLSDTEIVAVLATQRRADGKHRFSANEIYALVKGARADVLALVRQLRQTTEPEYRDYPGPVTQIQPANGQE